MESDIDALFVSFPTSSTKDREAREQWFVGDIAEWSKQRAIKLGDLIVAKHIYVEWVFGERHNAAWLEHSGKDQDTGEKYHVHHILRDCMRGSDSSLDEIGSSDCPVLMNALTERALSIGRSNGIQETLKVLEGLDKNEYQDMVLFAMEEAMVMDRDFPGLWAGNLVSGQHEVVLMGEMMHLPADTVRMYADILEIQGKVQIEGDTLRLAA